MFKRTVLSTAIVVAISAPAGSGVAFAEEVEKLDKIQVTGSRISRVDVEGVAPVTIITREDINKSGATSVSDVLRSLTENGGSTYNESFTNSFAPGSSFVSLRGLGSSRTLILLNGRRVANYGFAQNVNETGVDLNSIPLGAVERIEVLKDGASAIYGSDAIAGVVNVILKDNFDGAAVSSTLGMTTERDGKEGKLNVVVGKDFNDSNAMLSFDYFKRGAIKHTDRELTKSANQERNGGYNFTSSRSPYPTIVKDSGNVCDDPTGNNCRYDYAKDLDIMPATERYGLLGILTHDFNDSITGFTELSYNHVITNNRSAPTPDFDNREIAADNPSNPYNEPITVRARYEDVGPRLNDSTNDAYRFVGGFRGAFELADKDVDWDIATGYSRNKTESKGRNFINTDKLYEAIDSGAYNPLNPRSNPQSVIDTFRVSTKRSATSEMSFIAGGASMPVFSLPAGDVYLAVGSEWKKESINDKPDPEGSKGNILGSGGTGSKGSRNSKAVFGEFSIPLLETVEMQVAARLEDYSDFGKTLDPKVAFRWQPMDNLMFRSSYSTAFKAPTLPELYLGQSISYVRATDTEGCKANPGNAEFCNVNQYKVRSSGNSKLEAEQAESFNFGIVYQPVDAVDLKLDLYKIRNTNVIEQLSVQRLVNENDSSIITRKTDGTIDYVNNQYLNVAKQVVTGADFEAAYSWDYSEHDFKLTYKTSYIHSFKKSNSVGVLEDLRQESGVAGGSGPHLKSRYIFSWDVADHGMTFTTNYKSSYKQPRAVPAGQPDKIKHWYTFDVQYVYRGIDSTKLTLGVRNLTDKSAPFSNYNNDGYDQTAHDMRGRFVYAKAVYNF